MTMHKSYMLFPQLRDPCIFLPLLAETTAEEEMEVMLESRK